MNDLKLYVWEGVLTDYSDGIMFALADSEANAREMILAKCPYVVPEDLAKTPKLVSNPEAFVVWGGG